MILHASGPVWAAPASTPAAAEPFLIDRAAVAYYEKAGEYASRGDLRGAAAELDAAFAIEPHPELLFIRAELRRQLGECGQASILYRAFLAGTPSESAARQAAAGLAACTEPTAPTAPAPPPAIKVEPPKPRPSAKPARPWRRDPLAGVLLGLGSLSLAASGGLAAALVVSDNADDHDLHSEFDRQVRRGVALRSATAATTVLGLGLLTSSLLRYRKLWRGRTRISWWLDGRGVGVGVGGRF